MIPTPKPNPKAENPIPPPSKWDKPLFIIFCVELGLLTASIMVLLYVWSLKGWPWW